MEKKVIGAIAIVMLLMFAGFTSVQGAQSSFANGKAVSQSASAPSEATSKVFRYATADEPLTLDPAWVDGPAGMEVVQNVYETLIGLDDQNPGVFVPKLAIEVPTSANGGISPDGLTYTFHLRQGVRFHDGTLLSANDAAFSIRRAMLMNDFLGPAWALGQVLLPNYLGPGVPLNMDEVNYSVQSMDPILQFHLSHPYAGFLSILTTTAGSVVSEEYVNAHGGVMPTSHNDWMNSHEAGTGPFTLTEWTPGSMIRLQRFADYWQELSAMNEVQFIQIPDAGTRAMMLLSGEVSSAQFIGTTGDDLVGKPGIRTYEMLPSRTINFIGMNQNIAPGLDVGNISTSFFADKNVRLAFAHILDYGSYSQNVLGGKTVLPNGPIPMGMFGYDPSIPTYDFNLTKTAQYLQQAMNPNDPTKSYAETGFTLKAYYNIGNGNRHAILNMLKASLESLNQNTSLGITGSISLSVEPMDWPSYLDARAQRQLPIVFSGWYADYPDPDDFANPLCHQYGAFPTMLGWGNATLTALVEQAATDLNATLRAAIYSDISRSCHENVYYLWTDQPTNFHAERTWVSGYSYNPFRGGLDFYALDIHITLPSAPRSVIATGGDASVSLNWSMPAELGSADSTGWNVYRGFYDANLTLLTVISDPERLNYTDLTVMNRVSYNYSVAMNTTQGEGQRSDPVTVLPRPPISGPQNCTATVMDNGIYLHWELPETDGSRTLTAYNVYRSYLNSSALIGSVAAVSYGSSFTDLNATLGATYLYEVSAVFGLLESERTGLPPISFTVEPSLYLHSMVITQNTSCQLLLDGNVRIAHNHSGVGAVMVDLAYSDDDGVVWVPIGSEMTTTSGYFDHNWTPPASGSYRLRATLSGDDRLFGAVATVTSGVRFISGTAFIEVDTNSTLSTPVWDQGSKVISFNLSGPSGTSGHADVVFSKELASNGQDIRLSIDGANKECKLANMGNFWLVSFSYTHSQHSVAINTGAASASSDGTVLIILAVVAGLLVMVGAIVLLAKRKKK